jgi:DNA-binding response OmpR family regulator
MAETLLQRAVLLLDPLGLAGASVHSTLAQLGCRCHVAEDIEFAISTLAMSAFDMAVYVAPADVRNHSSTCAALREADELLWIVVLADLHFHQLQADCLRSGADLVLHGPSNTSLWRSVLAMIDRRSPHDGESQRPAATLNLRTMELSGATSVTQLTESEARLLSAMIVAPSRSAEYWQLMEAAKMSAESSTRRALEIRMSRLRSKLQAAGLRDSAIQAVRGWGYRLTQPLHVIR